jgi:hypothetical protein
MTRLALRLEDRGVKGSFGSKTAAVLAARKRRVFPSKRTPRRAAVAPATGQVLTHAAQQEAIAY